MRWCKLDILYQFNNKKLCNKVNAYNIYPKLFGCGATVKLLEKRNIYLAKINQSMTTVFVYITHVKNRVWYISAGNELKFLVLL